MKTNAASEIRTIVNFFEACFFCPGICAGDADGNDWTPFVAG